MHVSESYNNKLKTVTAEKGKNFFFPFYVLTAHLPLGADGYVGGLLLTKQNISFSSGVDNCIKVS